MHCCMGRVSFRRLQKGFITQIHVRALSKISFFVLVSSNVINLSSSEAASKVLNSLKISTNREVPVKYV